MRRDLGGRIGFICVTALCVALSGCGLIGGGDGESAQVLTIGTAVTTTTTTTVDPSDEAPAGDSGDFYRKLAENMEASTSDTTAETSPTETTEPADPYCLAMEQFVFETTQMFLADDVPSILERHGAAIDAIDATTGDSPDSVAAPARQVRQVLLDAIAPAGTTASAATLQDALTAAVSANSGLIDGLLSTTIDECGAEMSDPLRSVQEGLSLLAGG